jgi:hypothetical protein
MRRPDRQRRRPQCTKRNTPIAAWSLGASCRLHHPQHTTLPPLSSSKTSEFVPYVVASPYCSLLSAYSQVTSRSHSATAPGMSAPTLWVWVAENRMRGASKPLSSADLVRATLFPPERSVNNPECTRARVVRLPRNGQSAFEGRTWICSMASHRRSADSSEPVSKVEIHLPRPIGWPASPEVG